MPDQRPFDNRSHRFFGWNAGRSDEGEAADSARFKRAHRGSGNAAQIVTGKLLRSAPTDQQQSLGFQSDRLMQQVAFKWLARHFAARQQIRGRGLHGRVAGSKFELRLCLFVFFFVRRIGGSFFRMIQHYGNQRFGFELAGVEREIVVFMMSSANTSVSSAEQGIERKRSRAESASRAVRFEFVLKAVRLQPLRKCPN